MRLWMIPLALSVYLIVGLVRSFVRTIGVRRMMSGLLDVFLWPWRPDA